MSHLKSLLSLCLLLLVFSISPSKCDQLPPWIQRTLTDVGETFSKTNWTKVGRDFRRYWKNVKEQNKRHALYGELDENDQRPLYLFRRGGSPALARFEDADETSEQVVRDMISRLHASWADSRLSQDDFQQALKTLKEKFQALLNKPVKKANEEDDDTKWFSERLPFMIDSLRRYIEAPPRIEEVQEQPELVPDDDMFVPWRGGFESIDDDQEDDDEDMGVFGGFRVYSDDDEDTMCMCFSPPCHCSYQSKWYDDDEAEEDEADIIGDNSWTFRRHTVVAAPKTADPTFKGQRIQYRGRYIEKDLH